MKPCISANPGQPHQPSAWACFAENGNCIIWSTDRAAVQQAATTYGRPVTPLHDISAAPVAIMDTRIALGLCAPTEENFPALYALQGRRVALVDLGPAVEQPDTEALRAGNW